MGSLDVSSCMEEYSVGYVQSVLAVAGLSLHRIGADRYGVDFTIRDLPVSVDVQIKATQVGADQDKPLRYSLDVRTYDILRAAERNVPGYLFVVEVPEEQNRWATHERKSLRLRHHGYFRAMAGLPPTSNKTKITVTIPRENRITASALQSIMDQARGSQ